MAAIAGELYLRLLIERIVGEGERAARGPVPVRDAGAALVAVGAVDPVLVEQLHTDLTLALALRRPSPDATQLAGAVGPAPADPVTDPARLPGVAAARAVATGPNGFETAEGTLVVECVSFGTDGATILEVLEADRTEPGPAPMRRGRRISTWPLPGHEPARPTARGPRLRPARPGAAQPGDQTGPGVLPRGGGPGTSRWGRAGGPAGAGPGREQLRIVDDRGVSYRRGPGSGAGTGARWRWISSLDPVPPPGTPWLELSLGDGPPARLVVTPPGGVTHGRAHGHGPGPRWLQGALQDAVARALASGTPPETEPVEEGVRALLATGFLVAGDPLVTQVGLLAGRPAGDGRGLDESLASPLAGRDRRPSPTPAVWPVAHVVDLGDRTARLDVAILDDRGLRLSGWFSPWPPGGRTTDGTAGWRIDAFDDRHNRYVTTVADAHRSPDGADVTWRVWPALDPSARSVRLGVTGGDRAASVEIVLR